MGRFSDRERDAYPHRFLACLAGALLCVLILARLPWYPASPAIGWVYHAHQDRADLSLVSLPERDGAQPTSLITHHLAPLPEAPAPAGEPKYEEAGREQTALPLPPPERLLARRVVLDFSEQQPAIQGGLGAYYINIEYPQEAIDAGIEGRLILSFIVEVDGRLTDISVLKPLHPLCDSAAVRALRTTRFIPGKQNGEPVAVRMRMPVKFQLVAPGASSSLKD